MLSDENYPEKLCDGVSGSLRDSFKFFRGLLSGFKSIIKDGSVCNVDVFLRILKGFITF